MNQRALQKAHESNHRAVTREAVRTGGGEESRTGFASDPQPLPRRGPASAGQAPGPAGVLSWPRGPGPTQPRRGSARREGGPPQGTAPPGSRHPQERAALTGQPPGSGQWPTQAPCDCAGTSLSPFRSIRCPCVRKIRAEANSYVEQAIKIISAASLMCKTPNDTSTSTLTHLSWQRDIGREIPWLSSSQLKTQRGQVDNCWGIASSSFV